MKEVLPRTDGKLHAVLIGVLKELRVECKHGPLSSDVQIVRRRYLDNGKTTAHSRDLHFGSFGRQLKNKIKKRLHFDVDR